ncbi:MAG: DNA-processing protein DprA [Desulfamplus sp.]
MSQTLYHYLPWFILKNIPGVGNILYKRLIQRFGSPDDVLNAHQNDLAAVKGMSKKTLSAILNPAFRASSVTDQLKKEMQQIERAGFKIVTMVEQNYPALLKQIPDPPPYFTYIGSLDPVSDQSQSSQLPSSIAIVGSREATSYGLKNAESLAYDLVLNGFEVVSGMAIGIDTSAHRGALKAGGRTVAVLGSGLSKIYPSENRGLFYKIADNGAVISEFRVNDEPEGRHFPIRNRIIAGISLGTVVVEAAQKSGSLITARLAAEYNREVFAVPGDIHSFKSAGTHALLKQGAKLVANYIDIVEEFAYISNLKVEDQKHCDQAESKKSKSKFKENSLFEDKPNNQKNKTDKQTLSLFEPDNYQSAVLNILQSSPMHIDKIIEQSGLDTAGITAALMALELMGIVKHSPGKMFYKNSL